MAPLTGSSVRRARAAVRTRGAIRGWYVGWAETDDPAREAVHFALLIEGEGAAGRDARRMVRDRLRAAGWLPPLD
jgi:beta-lactamase class D